MEVVATLQPDADHTGVEQDEDGLTTTVLHAQFEGDVLMNDCLVLGVFCQNVKAKHYAVCWKLSLQTRLCSI